MLTAVRTAKQFASEVVTVQFGIIYFLVRCGKGQFCSGADL
jgi:hypothetical protein